MVRGPTPLLPAASALPRRAFRRGCWKGLELDVVPEIPCGRPSEDQLRVSRALDARLSPCRHQRLAQSPQIQLKVSRWRGLPAGQEIDRKCRKNVFWGPLYRDSYSELLVVEADDNEESIDWDSFIGQLATKHGVYVWRYPRTPFTRVRALAG